MTYGPEITDRQLAYGNKVTLDTAYGLTVREAAMKTKA